MNTDCPICFESINYGQTVTIFNCRHQVHLSCYYHMCFNGQQNLCCPFCQQTITINNDTYGTFPIFVTTCNRPRLIVHISSESTIRDLKMLIAIQTSCCVDLINLSYCGRYLVNDQTIKTCGIMIESTVMWHTRF